MLYITWSSQVVLVVKNLPREPPWTEEPGGLQSTRSQRIRHDWSDLVRTYITYYIKDDA